MSETLDFESALAALGRGEVVAVPTDTVYGLAASIPWSKLNRSG